MKFRDFFYMHKSDRQVLLVLIGIALIALLLIFGIGGRQDETLLTAADSLYADSLPPPTYAERPRYVAHRQPPAGYYQAEEQRAERFCFDPNTADSTQLLRLGLQPWQVKNIYRYRAKGGIYRQPADFARLYGLTVKQYKELEPYIRIAADYAPASTLVESRQAAAPQASPEAAEAAQPRYTAKLREGEYVLLNEADTAELKTVPGIGSGYARAIVRYGERLGGYVSTEQLAEIDGFPPSALPYFRVAARPVRQLNVNRLSLSQLRAHPYLDFYQAKAIVDYRRLHGPLHSLDELRLLKEFPPAAISRLQPYVAF